MGNKAKQMHEIQPDQLYEAVKVVMLHQGINFTQKQLEKPISIILTDMQQHHPFKQTDNKDLCVNNCLIRMFYCQFFTKQLLKILKHFMQRLQQINKQSLMFLKGADIEYLTLLANFILFSSNENILALFDSLMVRSDVDQSNRQTLRQIQSREDQVQICENLVERMAAQQIKAVQKILRVTLVSFIELRQQALSRSEQTLNSLAYLQQAIFMLYTKIYFSQPQLYRTDSIHSEVSREKEHFKKNMMIGAYFMASGSSYCKPSIFETAILFLQSLINIMHSNNNQDKNLTLKTLPSHLFKNLPVVPSSSLFDYIACNILFCLKYIKQGPSSYIRFICNRIQALKLIEKLLYECRLQNQTITYYLQQLCLQVKVGQIQRACLQQICKTYINTLTEKSKKSQILQKFLQNSDLKYNLKFAGKQVRISTNQLLTQLQDDDDVFTKEYSFYNQKYLYENIINQQMNYCFDDRLLWNQILPGILENKQDEQVRIQSSKKMLEQDDDQKQPQLKNVESKQKEQLKDQRKVQEEYAQQDSENKNIDPATEQQLE